MDAAEVTDAPSIQDPTAPERTWTRILNRWRKCGRRHGLRERTFRFRLRHAELY
jgi:hypothetical protein